MKSRLLRVVKWLVFPAFYLACLLLFGYLTFPFDRLRDRLVAELEKRGRLGRHIEIGKLGPYLLTGVELTNAKIYFNGNELGTGDATKEGVVQIDQAHARVRILPLLLGRIRIDVWAATLGGEATALIPVGASGTDFRVEVSHIDLSKLDLIPLFLGGLPIRGTVTGSVVLNTPEGRFTKASGNLDLTASDMSVSDGKTKIAGLMEFPTAKVGELKISGEAKDGQLRFQKIANTGPDLEIQGDGKLNLREPWNEVVADLFVRFKFSDAYRDKNTTTKTLLGEPGSAIPPTLEMMMPKFKAAKRPDGFYGWHISGPFKRIRYDPTATDMPGASPPPARRGRPADGGRRPSAAGSPDVPHGESGNHEAPPPADLAPAPPPPMGAVAPPAQPTPPPGNDAAPPTEAPPVVPTPTPQ